MQKAEISIILPSLDPIEDAWVYQDYLKSDIKDRLYVQFVYLRNGMNNADQSLATIDHFDTHEILRVPHHSFITAGERNFTRVQDFIDLLKPRLFVIGNDDLVIWDAFEAALEFYDDNQLDVLGWQWNSLQLKTDGTYSALPVLAPMHAGESKAYDIVGQMFSGEALDSAIAFQALLSSCGPLYWTTFFGNQFYSRAAFAKMLQYRFTEDLCSFFFMQAQFLSDQHLRYGFFALPVIDRYGREFMKQRLGQEQPGGNLGQHRAFYGQTRVSNVLYLAGMADLDGDALFNAFANSVGVSVLGTEDEEQTFGQYYMLFESVQWLRDVVRYKLLGASQYYPDLVNSGCVQDLRYAYRFLKRLTRCISEYPTVYRALKPEVRQFIEQATNLLHRYLYTIHSDDAWLTGAYECLSATLSGIEQAEVLIGLHQASFEYYLAQKTAETTPTLKAAG